MNTTISLDTKDTVLDQIHLRLSRARRNDELANFTITKSKQLLKQLDETHISRLE
jgi:hypothetical protein